MSSKIIPHKNSHTSNSALLSVLAFPALVAVGIIERIEERRELNRLLNMPDYQLKDIGLQRHDIQRKSMEPLWWRGDR